MLGAGPGAAGAGGMRVLPEPVTAGGPQDLGEPVPHIATAGLIRKNTGTPTAWPSAPGRAWERQTRCPGSHDRGRICTVTEQTRHLPAWPGVAVAAGHTETHRRPVVTAAGGPGGTATEAQRPQGRRERGQQADPGSGVACGGRGAITGFSQGPAPPAPRGCAGCKRRPGSIPGKGLWCTAFRPEPGAPVPRAECEGPAPQEEGPGHSGAPGTRQQHGLELGPRWLVPEPRHPQAERQ